MPRRQGGPAGQAGHPLGEGVGPAAEDRDPGPERGPRQHQQDGGGEGDHGAGRRDDDLAGLRAPGGGFGGERGGGEEADQGGRVHCFNIQSPPRVGGVLRCGIPSPPDATSRYDVTCQDVNFAVVTPMSPFIEDALPDHRRAGPAHGDDGPEHSCAPVPGTPAAARGARPHGLLLRPARRPAGADPRAPGRGLQPRGDPPAAGERGGLAPRRCSDSRRSLRSSFEEEEPGSSTLGSSCWRTGGGRRSGAPAPRGQGRAAASPGRRPLRAAQPAAGAGGAGARAAGSPRRRARAGGDREQLRRHARRHRRASSWSSTSTPCGARSRRPDARRSAGPRSARPWSAYARWPRTRSWRCSAS